MVCSTASSIGPSCDARSLFTLADLISGPRALPLQPNSVGADEAVQHVEGQVGCRVDLAGGQVQDAAAADGGQLVPVAKQRQADLALVGDGQQRTGGVLVEHPGLVDDQPVPRLSAALTSGDDRTLQLGASFLVRRPRASAAGLHPLPGLARSWVRTPRSALAMVIRDRCVLVRSTSARSGPGDRHVVFVGPDALLLVVPAPVRIRRRSA